MLRVVWRTGAQQGVGRRAFAMHCHAASPLELLPKQGAAVAQKKPEEQAARGDQCAAGVAETCAAPHLSGGVGAEVSVVVHGADTLALCTQATKAEYLRSAPPNGPQLVPPAADKRRHLSPGWASERHGLACGGQVRAVAMVDGASVRKRAQSDERLQWAGRGLQPADSSTRSHCIVVQAPCGSACA